MAVIIGIDLGTTNSLGCVFRDGQAELIPNRYGSFLTPSVVSVLEDGKVLVGQPAKERRITHPDQTFFSFKKDMGTDRKYKAENQEFTPEELSALVVSSILEDAKAYLGEEIKEAVISVPAYFHDRQRAATKRAGALAGVKVERILNEPSAAALANYRGEKELRHFLIFDFGGGTLDVSIVECIGTVIEIQAVSGDNHLGCDDFDELIVRSFLEEHKLKKKELSVQEYAALAKKAEQCKIALSTKDEETLHLTVKGKVYESTYDMNRLMKEGAELLMRIRGVVAKALKDCRIHSRDISKVIMVGGSSKMPLIQSYVRHLFHKKPAADSNCDEEVALGLGLFCGIKERKEEIRNYILADICPFSLGTEVYNESDPENSLMSTIIARNSVLPCSREQTYTTVRDMQKECEYKILQGEQVYAKDNVSLGSFKIPLTPLPQGEEEIRVRYSYDINGILMVDATVKSTGKVYSNVMSGGMSEKELEERMKALALLKADPFEIPENQRMIVKLKSVYEEASPGQKDVVQQLLLMFTGAIAAQSPAGIEHAKKMIGQLLPQLEVWDPFVDKEQWNDLFKGREDDWDDPFDEEMPDGWYDPDDHPGGYLS